MTTPRSRVTTREVKPLPKLLAILATPSFMIPLWGIEYIQHRLGTQADDWYFFALVTTEFYLMAACVATAILAWNRAKR